MIPPCSGDILSRRPVEFVSAHQSAPRSSGDRKALPCPESCTPAPGPCGWWRWTPRPRRRPWACCTCRSCPCNPALGRTPPALTGPRGPGEVSREFPLQGYRARRPLRQYKGGPFANEPSTDEGNLLLTIRHLHKGSQVVVYPYRTSRQTAIYVI